MAENLGKVERLETPQKRGKPAELAEVLEAPHGEYHSAKITVPLRTLVPKNSFTSGRGRFLNSLPWAFSDREGESGSTLVPFHLDYMKRTCYDCAVCRAFLSLSKCCEDTCPL